jgi:hypothetical protein
MARYDTDQLLKSISTGSLPVLETDPEIGADEEARGKEQNLTGMGTSHLNHRVVSKLITCRRSLFPSAMLGRLQRVEA